MERMLNVGLDEETQRRRDRRRRARTRRSSPRSGATRTRPPASTTTPAAEIAGSARTSRRCGRSARPGSTTTASTRRRGRAAARLRRADRDRPRARAADRHPRPRPRGRDERDRRGLRDPRRARRRRAGDPALLLGPGGCEDAIERGWYCSFSGIVTYPSADELREAAARGSPTSCSWSRPTPPTWRRSRCGASRTSPPTSSPPREAVAEVRGVSYEELERTVEANARALFGW